MNRSPRIQEGAGNVGCAARTRSLACKSKKHTSVVTTGTPQSADIPCALVLTAYNVLSPATNSSCHRRRRIKVCQPGRALRTSADLTPATGARTTRSCRPQLAPLVLRDPDHSPAEARPAINSARRAAASTASRPTFVTMANAPLVGAGCAEGTTISDFRKEKYLAPGLATQISLNPLTKLTFRRRRFRAVEDRTSEMNRCELIKLICPSSGKALEHSRG